MVEPVSVMESDCPSCGGWPSETDGSCVWCVRTLNAWSEGEIRADKAYRSLRNVLMLARREKRRPGSTPNAMDHMIRFCREAGVVPTILREGAHNSAGEGDG